jgi:hypothetical protein
MPTEDDDDTIDGCDLDYAEDPTSDEDLPYVALFAEALDPATPKTVEEAESEWRELFG